MKVFRVQFRDTPPQVLKPPIDPKSYYFGKIAYLAVKLDPSNESEQELRNLSKVKVINRWIYSSSKDFVQNALQDSRAVIFKLSCLSSASAKMMTLSLHALDLDAGLGKPEKESLRQFLYDTRGACTVSELVQRYDGFRKCWKDAQALIGGARRHGRRAELISSGCKGFRLLVFDSSELFVTVSRAEMKGSAANVQKAIFPVLQEFFGMEVRDPIIDSSIYGENKGVRTSFSFHAATGIWPAVIRSEHDRYGHSELHGPTQELIADFWIGLIDAFPVAQDAEDDEDDEIISTKAKGSESRKHPLANRASSASIVKRRAVDKKSPNTVSNKKLTLRQCTGFGSNLDVNDDDDMHLSDNFDDVISICEAQGWVIQSSSLANLVPGQAAVNCFIEKRQSSNAFSCPKKGRVHVNNSWRAVIDRITGDIRVICGDHECHDADFDWPVIQSAGYLGSDPLFAHILVDPNLNDHTDLASLLANRLRERILYIGDGMWRFYCNETGTWHLEKMQAAAHVLVREILKEYLEELIDQVKRQSESRTGQTARLCHAAQSFLEKLVRETGSSTFVQKFGSVVAPFLTASREVWAKNFKSHLPVKGALLHFCKDGQVVAKAYKPELHVMHEFQADIEWCPDAPIHEGLEEILQQWWDAELQRSFLQFFAYSLSRTALQNYFFWIYGPPGSGKSSVLGMCAEWFGKNNVGFMPDAGILVQNGRTHDNNGTSHNSTLIHAFDKALIVFSEPPNGSKCVLRDGDFKRMTGSGQQTGRLAYSGTVQSWERTYTMCMDTNRLIPPQDPTDEAIWRRIKVIKTNRIFYSDDSHKKRVAEKMDDESNHVKMMQADSEAVERVKQDPKAASYFLRLIVAAWNDFVVKCNKNFFETTESKAVRENFISSLEEDKDSVTAFCKTQVKRSSFAAVAKADLFAAYSLWWDKNNQIEALDTKVDQRVFYEKVGQHFAHPPLIAGRATVRKWELLPNGEGMFLSETTHRARTWNGIQLHGPLFGGGGSSKI